MLKYLYDCCKMTKGHLASLALSKFSHSAMILFQSIQVTILWLCSQFTNDAVDETNLGPKQDPNKP
jgi:hypothetical protein